MFRRFSEELARLLAILAALGLLTLVVFLVIDLFGRNLFGFTTTFANEWSSFVNGAVILLAAPYAFLKGDHIRVELIALLKFDRVRQAIVLVADIVCLLVAIYLFYAVASTAWESFANDRRSTWVMRTPLWIPQATLALGAFAFIPVALLRLLQSASALRARD